MRRNGVRGVAADHDSSAAPRPGQHQRLDRAVDNVGIGIERCGDLGDVAAVLRQPLLEQVCLILSGKVGARRLGIPSREIALYDSLVSPFA